jgi:choline dehydrogenase
VTDTLIVGGGSAGAALATRLSEDSNRNVVLLEAGRDVDRARVPADVADASCPTVAHDWGYAAETVDGRSVAVPRARLMGGCSSTNATAALRGAPSDYDEWAALGNEGWAWADLLPFFCKLETDLDFADAWHGQDGPIAIRRATPEQIREHQLATLDAALELGVQPVEDHNRPGAVGVGLLPRNERWGVRMSTALTYLEPARERPNLTLRAHALVDCVVVQDGRARGVRLAGGETLDADEVVVSAGAYNSPSILLRSGIGSATDLRALGVDVVADLPVGANLMEHPLVSVDYASRAAPGLDWFQTAITCRSDHAGSDPYDLHLLPGGPVETEPGQLVFIVLVGVMRPQSRGSVSLRSLDPAAPPRIVLGGLREAKDVARMVEGVERARELVRTPPLSGLLVGDELRPGPGDLEAAVLREVGVYHHASGTCAMGSVVDNEGRVLGVEALRVVDASIMPTIPAANTNLPTIMLAERIAAMMTA